MKTNTDKTKIVLEPDGWKVITFGKEGDENWGRIAQHVTGAYMTLEGRNFSMMAMNPSELDKLLGLHSKVTEQRSPTPKEWKRIKNRFELIEKIRTKKKAK